MRQKYIKILTVMIICAATCLMCVFAACASAKPVGISIRSEEEMTVNVGDIFTLRTDVEMSDGSKYTGKVNWSADKEGIITSESNAGGVYTAEKAGEVTVTASVPDTKYSASCKVEVVEPGTVFRVGVKDDVEKFSYRDPLTGEYKGFEIDLASDIAYALDYDEVKFVPVTADNREEKLEDGQVDCVVATYSITEERQQVVNFSDKYYTDYVKVLKADSYADTVDADGKAVSVTTLSEISDYVASTFDGEDVTPCRIGTAEGSTAYRAFTTYCDEANTDEANTDEANTDGDGGNSITVTDPSVGDYFVNVEYEDYRACEKALDGGDIDLFIADTSILMSHTPSGATLLENKLESQDYGVATAKGDASLDEEETELTLAVNGLIKEWLDDNTIHDLLVEWGITEDDTQG